VVGPTGVGKTALALDLASILGTEIVGADAFQIYEGIPILTAQPTPAQRARVPHHLVGCVPISSAYDAAAYQRDATRALSEIANRGLAAIIAGGTGLYVRALAEGLSPTPPSDPALRVELDATPLDALVERLRRADPDAPAQVDLRNKRRVTRAIEICELSAQPLARFRDRPRQRGRGVLLTRDRDDLNARIESHVRAMFDAGVVNEVAALPPPGLTASRTVGLREIQAHLRGELPLDACRAAIVLATRQLAKRQLTWFRNQTSFPPLNLTGISDPEEAVQSAVRALAAT